ncbi:aromatic ring-hydroxylating oxygenase subunit alpha [Rahnella woolbedingensis]|uniref:Aromatic ring-hydroxylating dioxygenase subunit alpha n=1 Tax=Rahnella woolbedingensis TaxID=1510574 RepID=A0A419N2C6_9GAMM|nr:aromatic ring-hydroxylating dioxygenase subunit alpha [Rahnella woolbedingensis]RJT34207.1 aromatic ring-hydroxylating dioxygenase subunit alpha [Rahnella woolbedingensis]
MNNVKQSLIPVEYVDRVLTEIHDATGMPNDAYTSKDYFCFERDNVLGKTWTCIGFSADLSSNGFVKPVDFMHLPLLIMKNRLGEIQVFHNVCSHRGMKLVHESGPVQGVLRCAYHSWTYDLDGNLKGTPHVGGIGQHKDERFKCEKHGLKPLRSAVWMGMVFINLSGDAEAFSHHIAPLEQRWQAFLGEQGLSLLRQVASGGSLQIGVNSNWKLAVENYCEAYHLPWVHPALNSYSRLEDHYNIMFSERFAGQGSTAYNLSATAGTHLPEFPDWPAEKTRHAEYVALFPNVLLGIQVDHAFAMMIEPISAEKSIEHLRLFYVGDEATTEQYAACRQATLESWRVVFGEDISAVEGMQQGRASPGFNGGVFSPEMDVPTHFFQKWLASRVKQALRA